MTKNKYYKGVVSLVMAACLLAGTFPVGIEASEEISGDIKIGSAEELAEFSKKAVSEKYSSGLYIELTNDIDLSSVDFKPVSVLAGTFDGNGHKITGFRLYDYASESGFINTVAEKGIVRNLTLEGMVLPKGDAENTGGIAGVNKGLIENCIFEGRLIAAEAAGGIAGHNEESGRIVDCENRAMVVAARRAGGVAGFNEGAVMSSKNSGSVNTVPQDDEHLDRYRYIDEEKDEDESDLGGFSLDAINFLNDDLSEQVMNKSRINYTGGIAGASSGIVRDCTNSGEIGYLHLGYNTGGIVGYERGILTGCKNTGRVYGRKNVGGITGQFEPYYENIYSEDALDRSKDEMDRMTDLMDELNDIAQDADDETQGKIDNIRDTMDDLRGTVSGYKEYYRWKNDITQGEVRGKVDHIRDIVDDIDLKKIEVADYSEAIKRDIEKLISIIRDTDSVASGGVSIDMRAYIAALKDLNNDLHNEIKQVKGVAKRLGKNAGNLIDGIDDTIDAVEDFDDYLRDRYDSYKSDIRNTDDDITSRIDTLSEQSDALSDSLKASDRKIRDQIDRIVDELLVMNDTLHEGFDEIEDELRKIRDTDSVADIFDDMSDTKDKDPGIGKITECVNEGYIKSDINGGGIIGYSGVEVDTQSDFEVVSGGDISLEYSRTKQASVIDCKNYGIVKVRNNYAGGIVGRMDTGAVISSENYGGIINENGDYTGGIAGYASFVIRDSYAMQTISGNNYVGGIAGKAKFLYNNTSMTSIEGEGERYGSIAGILDDGKDDDDKGEASGNKYLDYGIAAINGLSMSEEAEEVSYESLMIKEDTPADIKKVRVTFVVDDKILAILERPYGGSISQDELPEIPNKGERVGSWEINGLDDIRQNMIVEADFETPTTTIASEETVPVLLVSGNLYADNKLLYERYGKKDVEIAGDYECVDKYLTQITPESDMSGKIFTYRLLADEYKDWYQIGVVENGKVVPVETKWDGNYMVFSMKGDGEFYVIRDKKHFMPYIIAAIAAALAVIAVIVLKTLGKNKVKKK